jgi:hypothetical protein
MRNTLGPRDVGIWHRDPRLPARARRCPARVRTDQTRVPARSRAHLRKAALVPEATRGPAYDGIVHTCEALEMPFRREVASAIRFDVLEDYASHESRENLFYMELFRCTRSGPKPEETSGMLKQGISPYFYDDLLFHALVLEAMSVKKQYRRVRFAKITTRGYFDEAEVGEIEIEIV